MDNGYAFDCQGTCPHVPGAESAGRPASLPDMTERETFDYVVVGAGAAGSAAAARIAEKGRHSVALIEAVEGARQFEVDGSVGPPAAHVHL